MSTRVTDGAVAGVWIMGLLGALSGCSEGGHLPPQREPTGAQAQPLVTVQRLADFSSSRQRVHTGPMALTTLGGSALFFGENSRALYRTDGTSEGTHLLRTLKWRPASMTPDIGGWSPPPRLVVLGPQAWWLGQDGLWTTDGTPEGTRWVGMLGLPEVATPPVGFDGALYFSSGGRLYRSDGTAQGTQDLAQVSMKEVAPVQAQEVGGKLYFACESAASGVELCLTDGTPAGTKVVTDLVPGTASASPRLLGSIAGRVVFSATPGDGTNVRRLYSSDGTEAGTLLLHPFASLGDDATGSGLAVELTVLQGAAYFPCQSEATGQELCRTEGTAATTQILDLIPGADSSALRKPSVLGTKLYFQACDNLGINQGHCRIWSSDGTLAGSELVGDLPPNTSGGIGMRPGLVPAGDALFFYGESSGPALWRTDGTVAGTRVLGRLTNVEDFVVLDLRRDAVAFGGKLLFTASVPTDVEYGLELWSSDGSVAGTQRVSDPTPRQGKGTALQLLAQDERLFVTAHPGGTGQALWRVEGPPPAIRTLHVSSASLNSWIGMAPVNGQILLSSANSLWATDDTSQGIHPLNVAGLNPGTLIPAGDRAFLPGRQLWQTDGTEAGTVLVEAAPANVSHAAFVNGGLWFRGQAPDQPDVQGLWTSTGQPGVTKFLGAVGAEPADFTGLGSLTLFSARDGDAGRELWKSDGTAAGTVRVADLRPGGEGSAPERLFAWKDHVYFWATGADGVTTLWKSDGTEAGTVRLRAATLRRGVEYGWDDGGFITWGDALYFAGQDAEGGRELWRTDGSDSGTVRVADLVPGPGSSNPNGFMGVSAEGPLLFAAYSPTKGRELWRLDSADGTPTLVADVVEGPRSSQPEKLTSVGSTLYFQADDGTGMGLYRLRGLLADTFAPRLRCPPPREVTTTSDQGASVSFENAAAYDDSGAPPALESTHPSGTTFPIGTTSVIFTATDAAGNEGTCTFLVTVTGMSQPDAGPTTPDAGVPPPEPPDDSGCGCQSGASSLPWTMALLGLLGLARRRSREVSGEP
ncbi:ELWxxDGT repeat protein [Myxococcus fulvus]|uniref:ELWxxDGT repeat protein n=1 Tax=Myxococcus fulvus TaxID=33 RepID=UPI003B98F83C